MRKNRHSRVSVALCTYNGAKYLAEQLNSILRQTLQPDEIVIIDDCSTDTTLDIIREFACQAGAIKHYVNEQNLGYVRNFSLAISRCTGDYVALADQDDIWMEDHLEKLMNHIGEKAVCVGDSMMIDSEGMELGVKFSEVKQNFYIPEGDVPKAYRIVYNYNPYQGASMLIDRRWVEAFLPIPAEAGFQDTFLAGCACLTQGISVIPDIINKYRVHDSQVSKIWKVTVFDEIKRRRHHICFPNKLVMIDCLLKTNPVLSRESLEFINEFKHILDLDRRKKRLEILRIKNRHYREIYSCTTDKYKVLRSLHFLLAL